MKSDKVRYTKKIKERLQLKYETLNYRMNDSVKNVCLFFTSSHKNKQISNGKLQCSHQLRRQLEKLITISQHFA